MIQDADIMEVQHTVYISIPQTSCCVTCEINGTTKISFVTYLSASLEIFVETEP